MIEVKNLTKQYAGCTAVEDVSFTVHSGKIYGFLGPNGAGKSTTMNIIAGCLAPTSGSVTVNGYDILESPIEAKKQIGYLPEQPPLYQEMTPYEYLTFVAEAKGVDSASIARQVSEVITLTGLTPMAHRIIRNLSKGYKQRVGIAQTMLGNPDIIILDEPTVGLDPKQIKEIRTLIRRLGEKKTVIVSSHILAEINAVCDHVIIISKGRVVLDDDIVNLNAHVSPTRNLSMTVKGDYESIRAAIMSVHGVSNVCVNKNIQDKVDGAVNVSVTIETAKDLRDDIFFALAGRKHAVLSMEQEELSLESIFLSLTDDSATEKKLAKRSKKGVR